MTETPIVTGHNIDWVTQDWVIPVMILGGLIAVIFGGAALLN